jgi:hypothetical protein
MNRSYHVLRESILADRVAEILTAAEAPWAGRSLTAERREIGTRLRSIQFGAVDSSTSVSLVGDDVAQTLYLAIEGGDLEEVRAIARAANTRLPIVPFDELLSDASTRYRSQPNLLIRLALGTTPVANTEALDLFSKAVRDTDPSVRKAAINALGLTQWVRAFDPLEDRTANDPEPELREFATLTLYSLRLALGMER